MIFCETYEKQCLLFETLVYTSLILSESEISKSDYLKESLKIFLFYRSLFFTKHTFVTPSNEYKFCPRLT
jgi:hypothetical protein